MNTTAAVLVTGGAGFIGSHLIDALLIKGNFVICIDNLSNGYEKHIQHNLNNENFVYKNIDINDIDALSRIFEENEIVRVYHFAANSDIQLGSEKIETDLNSTFLTTFHILSCMKQYQVKEIIFASTSAVYGELNELLSEDTGPLFPISLYGAAKLASEGYLSAFCENCGMKAWIVRFPNVIGWRLTHGVIYDFLNRLEEDKLELKVLGDGKQSKPYLYIDDLINAIDCIHKNSQEKINCFNVSANGLTTVGQIAEIVIQKLGLKDTKICYTGGDRGWVGDVPKFEYDISRVYGLNWRPTMSSDEAVALSIEKELAYRRRGT